MECRIGKGKDIQSARNSFKNIQRWHDINTYVHPIHTYVHTNTIHQENKKKRVLAEPCKQARGAAVLCSSQSSGVQERAPYCLYPAGSLQGFLCGSPPSLWCSQCLSWRGDRRTCHKEDASALPQLTSAYHTGDTHTQLCISTHAKTHGTHAAHGAFKDISTLFELSELLPGVHSEFYLVTLKELLNK